MQQSELREYAHTPHPAPLTCREFLSYVQAQCEAHGCEHSPLTPARVRKMHALTKGNISKLNELAHLSMLAAWTERAEQVSPRHLRLAAGEILPAKKHGKRLATVGLFASVLFAACGWYLTSSIEQDFRFNCRFPRAGNSRRPSSRRRWCRLSTTKWLISRMRCISSI
jgi:general secretion pathway protein A